MPPPPPTSSTHKAASHFIRLLIAVKWKKVTHNTILDGSLLLLLGTALHAKTNTTPREQTIAREEIVNNSAAVGALQTNNFVKLLEKGLL